VPAYEAADRHGVDRLEQLLTLGRALTSQLELPSVLDRILKMARELTGARYAELRVLDGDGHGLSQFLTAGVTDEPREAIDAPPSGEGVLGVPITIRGQAWGHLYLTEKADAEDFNDDDLHTIVVLAEWAAVAIEHARLLGEAATRRQELERALGTSRAAMEIATAVGSDTDLPRILRLIGERARALVEADALLIWLRAGDRLQIAAVAGNADVPDDATIPLGTSTAGEAARRARSARVEDLHRMQVDPSEYGVSQARTTLIVPLVHRGRGLGVLMAFDHLGATASFDAEDQRALEAFAASAATAVATARSVEAQRLHDTMAAAESERRRWARELHDETLQGLASLKLALVGALTAEPDLARPLLESAVAQLEDDIAGLRLVIADLRPAALDELGLEPALRTLITRVAKSAGLKVRGTIDLKATRHAPDIETIAYRIAQEALTNVVKHASARTITVDAGLEAASLVLTVTDDGRGLGSEQGAGYGITGMRERAALASGSLEVDALPGGGTRVTLELPSGKDLPAEA